MSNGKERNAGWTVILSTMETYASRTLRVGRMEENGVIWRSRWTEKQYKFRTMALRGAEDPKHDDKGVYVGGVLHRL